jgi:alanine racemase
MAMVKAFAYGSGSYEIAGLLQYAGVDYLTVAYTDEGIDLRRSGITMPIMVMSPDVSSFSRMIAWRLEPELYNLRSLTTFIHYANTLGATAYPVHIKLDTGMHRLGFGKGALNELLDIITANPSVKVASIFSHLSASDDAREDAYTLHQETVFDEMTAIILQRLPYRPLLHLCNSAGIARHPELHYDMVRLGIGLYGEDSGHALVGRLQPIATLKTLIAQITDVRAGENIGYGHTTIAAHDMRIATICIGYADGYPRAMGNGNAYVMIHGQPATVTGNVCMDMCMVDVTHIPQATEGDEVVVMGTAPTAAQLATWAGTITYEVMTGISQRVKRVYLNEQ